MLSNDNSPAPIVSRVEINNPSPNTTTTTKIIILVIKSYKSDKPSLTFPMFLLLGLEACCILMNTGSSYCNHFYTITFYSLSNMTRR